MKNAFLLILFIALTSCNTKDDDSQIICTEEFVFGLSVTVRDATTNGIIPNGITVTAFDGNYSEELNFVFDTFLGAGEHPGNYILTIEGEGYETIISSMISVILTEDECHVIPKVLEFRLQPN